MSKANKNMIIKRIVDAVMTVLLLLLMAYQVTGEMAHEWIGMGMTVLVIIHQILNRKWYGALFKGKYNPYRSITTVLNILLIASFALTAFCGMSMSGYAVPFLYGMAPVSFVRRMHLSMSHWAFVLMGLHLGMHIPAMTAGLKLKDRKKTILACIFTCISGIGLWLFLRNSMPDYLFFRVPFAFLDYEKAGWLVFVENLLMLSFWAFIGTQTALVCRDAAGKAEAKKNPLLPVVAVMASVIIGIALMLVFPSADGQASFGNTDWSVPQAESEQNDEPAGTEEVVKPDSSSDNKDPVSVDDGFVLIGGGTFPMGSPESENWRIDAETQHQVSANENEATQEDTKEDTEAMLQMRIGDTAVTVEWEDNESVQALRDLCTDNPLTIQMSMYGGFEQVGSIGQSLPRNDRQTTTGAGDIVLYSGNQIVVFYGSNSWAYTRLGHITDQNAAGMSELLGNGDVTITISME